jgi:hypothetical protein
VTLTLTVWFWVLCMTCGPIMMITCMCVIMFWNPLMDVNVKDWIRNILPIKQCWLQASCHTEWAFVPSYFKSLDGQKSYKPDMNCNLHQTMLIFDLQMGPPWRSGSLACQIFLIWWTSVIYEWLKNGPDRRTERAFSYILLFLGKARDKKVYKCDLYCIECISSSLEEQNGDQ